MVYCRPRGLEGQNVMPLFLMAKKTFTAANDLHLVAVAASDRPVNRPSKRAEFNTIFSAVLAVGKPGRHYGLRDAASQHCAVTAYIT